MNGLLPLAYVLVTTFNGRRFLEKCFSTLEATDYPNMRLLLVDNGSTDDSVEFVRDNFPQVEILSLAANTSLAYAANLGFEYAFKRGAKFIAILNDDTEAVDSRWLGHAIALTLSDASVGMVGFLEVNPPQQPAIPEVVEVSDVDYLCGFALACRSDVLESVGLFDTVYGRFALEDDLEARVLEAGYRLKELSTPIFHHGGGTNQKYPLRTGYLQMRDGLRFSIKNRGLWRATMRLARIIDEACNPWPLICRDQSTLAHKRIRHCGNLFMRVLACCCAAAWNVIHLPQTLRIRRREAEQIRMIQLGTRRVGDDTAQELRRASEDQAKTDRLSPAPCSCVGAVGEPLPVEHN